MNQPKVINKNDELLEMGAFALHQMSMYAYYKDYLKVDVDPDILAKYETMHKMVIKGLEDLGVNKTEANAIIIKKLN
jgi:hypothetical protein